MKRLAPFASILLLLACEPEARKPSGLLPKIDSFTAEPSPAVPGQDVVLSWSTTNVIAVDIEPDVVRNAEPDGSITVRAEVPSLYTLVAKGDGALTMQSLVVEVRPPTMPVVRLFVANPQAIMRGSTTTLSWSVSDATTVYIGDQRGLQVYYGPELEGMISVLPSGEPTDPAATFELIAMDDYQQVANQRLEVVFVD